MVGTNSYMQCSSNPSALHKELHAICHNLYCGHLGYPFTHTHDHAKVSYLGKPFVLAIKLQASRNKYFIFINFL